MSPVQAQPPQDNGENHLLNLIEQSKVDPYGDAYKPLEHELQHLQDKSLSAGTIDKILSSGLHINETYVGKFLAQPEFHNTQFAKQLQETKEHLRNGNLDRVYENTAKNTNLKNLVLGNIGEVPEMLLVNDQSKPLFQKALSLAKEGNYKAAADFLEEKRGIGELPFRSGPYKAMIANVAPDKERQELIKDKRFGSAWADRFGHFVHTPEEYDNMWEAPVHEETLSHHWLYGRSPLTQKLEEIRKEHNAPVDPDDKASFDSPIDDKVFDKVSNLPQNAKDYFYGRILDHRRLSPKQFEKAFGDTGNEETKRRMIGDYWKNAEDWDLTNDHLHFLHKAVEDAGPAGGDYLLRKIERRPEFHWPNDEKSVAHFWHGYERSVAPHHFATVKSLYTNKPESITDHRGEEGDSEKYMSVLPSFQSYAQKAQEAIRQDPEAEIKHIDGVPHIKVYRGVGGGYAKKIREAANYDEVNGEAENKRLKLPVAPLTSWSTNEEMAKHFATYRDDDFTTRHGVVLQKWLPLSNLLHSGYHDVLPNQKHAHEHEKELVFGHPEESCEINTKDIGFRGPSGTTGYNKARIKNTEGEGV